MKYIPAVLAASTFLATAAYSQAAPDISPSNPVFSWDSYQDWASNAPDLSGETVTVLGAWLYPDYDFFRTAVAYFSEATGAEVAYWGSTSFSQQIVEEVEAGTAPNVSIFPQPGLAAVLASKGHLFPLEASSRDWVEENYSAGSSWVDLGTFPDAAGTDQFYGLFFNVNLKSLVWYSPKMFDAAGYAIPTSLEELLALSDQIIADGGTPWCIGLASGGASGWPGTDWIEDIMLRLHGSDVYDQWVNHEIPFNSPEVIEAFEAFGQFSKNDDMVSGGANSVSLTAWRESPAGLFSEPAGCFMHRQASFITSFFPEDVVLGEDVDSFYFPPSGTRDNGNPVLGGGNVVTVTSPSDATNAFMEFLQLPLTHEIMMAQTGFLTPHKGANTAAYNNDTLRSHGQILLDATTFRFDGSDLMPGEIGAGAFWTGMLDFTNGGGADFVTGQIEAAWQDLDN